MKCVLVGLCFLGLLQNLNAQQFTAKYKVTREVVSTEGNNSSTLATLSLEGYFYMKGSKVISFLKPLYLVDYPKGYIQEKQNDFTYHTQGLFMDSLQQIAYCNLDSMIFRNRSEMTGLNGKGANYAAYVKTGMNNWKVFPESKVIQGLTCQRATLQKPNGNPSCEIWFAIDIPMQIGLNGIFDVPGLIVEGEIFSAHEKFTLASYSFDAPISDSLFWPKEFNEPFTLAGKLKADNSNKPTSPAKN